MHLNRDSKLSPSRIAHLLSLVAFVVVSLFATACNQPAGTSGTSTEALTGTPAQQTVAQQTITPEPTATVRQTAVTPSAQATATSSAPSPTPATPTALPTPSPGQAAATPAASATVAPGSATTANLGPSFSAEQAKRYVDALAGQIGSRPAGSANQDAAVRYLSEQLRHWGYTPEVQEFPIRSYEDRGSQVSVVRPAQRNIEANTVQYAAAGQVEAPLVSVGLGRQNDFRGVDVRGKIALVRRGEILFSEKVENAAAAGASGVVIYNSSPSNIQASLTGPGSIPAATISGQQGEMLVRQLASGPVVVRLAVDGSVTERKSYNVVATKPGTKPGTVVIGGHMDSVPAGPGANDNASGTASMLELARVFSLRDYPYTLRFVAFGAEEIGLHGSRHYVDQLSPEERRVTVAMINLDMVGVGDAWRFGGTDSLVQRALQVANELNLPAARLGASLNRASDHANFMNAGIPSLFVYRTDDPNYHSPNDRPEHVDPKALGEAGAIVLRVLDGIAAEGR